jgi:hypothetical protein
MAKNMVKNPQRIVATRIPKITYDLLEERSKKENISLSALIRNILIGFLRADHTEIDKIRCYGSNKARMISEILEKEYNP